METVLLPATSFGNLTFTDRLTDYNGTVSNVVTSRNQNKSSARTVYRDKNRFIQLMNSGYLPQYPYNAVHFTYPALTLGDAQVTWGVNLTRTMSGMFATATRIVPDYSSAATTALATSLHNQVTSQVNSNVKNQYYSTFEVFYEGRKTKKMVFQAASTIAGTLRDVRRGRFDKAARRLGLSKTPPGVKKGRTLSQNWLEYRYGWTPLYLTVYGEMKRKYDLMRNKEPVQKISVSRAGTVPPNVTFSSNFTTVAGKPTGFTYRNRLTKRYDVVCRQVAYYKVHNTTLANTTSIGLTNPALVAWELVPFSFVADWFVNVSDCLEAFDAWAGKTYLAGSKTTLVRATETCSSELVSVAPGYTLARFKAPVYLTSSAFTSRVSLSSPPSVSLNFSRGLTDYRITDAIALIKQIVLK